MTNRLVIIVIIIILGNLPNKKSMKHDFGDSLADSECLFESKAELEECHDIFSSCSNATNHEVFVEKPSKPQRPPPPIANNIDNRPPITEPVSNNEKPLETDSDFFNSLNWEATENLPETCLLLNLDGDVSKNTEKNDANLEDLIGDINLTDSNKAVENDSCSGTNVNLLNELFSVETKANTIPCQISNLGNAPPLKPMSAQPHQKISLQPNSLSGIQRNTSSPNLTKLDPFASLDPLAASAPTIAPSVQPSASKLQNHAIPRVNSYNSFQSFQSRPDYNPNYFKENTSSTGTAKAPGHEFDDLLAKGGFQKFTVDNTNKSLAQMKKEEMVY